MAPGTLCSLYSRDEIVYLPEDEGYPRSLELYILEIDLTQRTTVLIVIVEGVRKMEI